MTLSPYDARALDEIATDLSSSDPSLAILLTVGPTGRTPERARRRMTCYAVLLSLVAYLHLEVGLIRGPVSMVYHAAGLAALAVVMFVMAARRADWES